MKLRKWQIFTGLLGALLLNPIPAFAQTVENTEAPGIPINTAETTENNHQAGSAGHGDYLPADYRVPADTPGADPKATPDAQGKVPHICAGKKLLHHSHVDAAYVTEIAGKMDISVVDGQSVVENPASVCVRLAPDARAEDGVEVSRWVVPGKSLFAFLGKPGDIIWRAPQEQIDNWRPVWAGIGAFDTAHEKVLPDYIKNGTVALSLLQAEGPGKVEVWRTIGQKELTRGLSTSENLPPLQLKIGAHGHWNWTFTKAGAYQLRFQASYEDVNKGQTATAPRDITWLVGSDAEVGLKPGTTSSVGEIKVSAEDLRAQMQAAGELTETPSPAPGAAPLSPEAARAQILQIVKEAWLPHPSTPSAYTLRGYFTADKKDDGTPFSRVAASIENKAGKRIENPVLEVPDSLQQDTPQGKRWILGAADRHSSLNFDFRQLDKEHRSEPVSFNIGVFNGPESARYLVEKRANTGKDNFSPLLDSASYPEEQYDSTGSLYQLIHVFDRPGFYEVAFDVQSTDNTGRFSYKSQTVYFAVGDSTIKELRHLTGEKDYAPLPADNPNQPGEAGTDSENTPDNSARQYLITSGHMDQALAYRAGKAQTFVEDTADPRQPRQHLSGSFAYAVPDSTHSQIPADARGYAELRRLAPQGVWALPEAQLEGVPWVGFSTLRVDYGQLNSAGVTVQITDFSGPGRFISGNDSLVTGGFAKRLDSADPHLHLHYAQPTHDHQAMYFTAPGKYQLTFLYTLHLKDGASLSLPLQATFLVGDKAIASAQKGTTPGTASEAPLPIEELLRRLNGNLPGENTGESAGTKSENALADSAASALAEVDTQILDSLLPESTNTEEKADGETDLAAESPLALLDPVNGTLETVNAPLWQWILLGAGIIAFTGASSWALLTRRKKERNN